MFRRTYSGLRRASGRFRVGALRLNRGVLAMIIAMTTEAAVAIQPIEITVDPQGGPPPLGAIVEASIPFASGVLKIDQIAELAVVDASGNAVPTQARPIWQWRDGSVRTVFVNFEASAGPGVYKLVAGKRPAGKPILSQRDDKIVLDTGAMVMELPDKGAGCFDTISAPTADGELVEIIRGKGSSGLVVTLPDGRQYSSRRAKDLRVVIEDNGPVCGQVRYEGDLTSEDGKTLFHFVIRWQAYRGRSQAVMTVIWENRDASALGKRIQDIRMHIPFSFPPTRFVAGCETGVYDAPFMEGNAYFITQEDHDQYWAKRVLPDGRIVNLATGGCNGKRGPGWMYVEADGRSCGLYVPRFWQEYPNELTAKAGELSVGLWPERANAYLAGSKVILPPFSDPANRYNRGGYIPILPHPYLAMFSAEDQCLDVPPGLAKTQQIVLDIWAGKGSHAPFEQKHANRSLLPVRGHVAPRYVLGTGAFGRVVPADPDRFPKLEKMFEEAYGWLANHAEAFDSYGKFDYGDWKYMVPSTTYLTCVGKWAQMQEMAREGYWHNNERDTLCGVLLHYLRTGDRGAFELATAAASHLYDVDISHVHWGMYKHTYGHCYRSDHPGPSDHSWLLGMLQWACMSGDPLQREWILRCGDALARKGYADFAKSDLRSTSMQLHMMSTFYAYTGEEKYREAAQGVAEILRELQPESGIWPPYLGRDKTHYLTMAFANHTVMALADYLDATEDERMIPVLDKAVEAFRKAGPSKISSGEIGLVLPGLDLLWRKTGDAKYSRFARALLEAQADSQCLVDDIRIRGEFWPSWTNNEPTDVKSGEVIKRPGRPMQWGNQVRPLTPATMLAYGVVGVTTLTEAEKP